MTTEAAQEAETVSATDRKILVLNSTDIAGLAGRWFYFQHRLYNFLEK